MQSLRHRSVWWQHRHILRRLQDQTSIALAAADVPTAVALLEIQLCCYKWPFQVEELLFRRHRRPKDSHVSQALLEALHCSPVLPPYQQFYAGIASVYAALDRDDQLCLQRLEPWLKQQADLAMLFVPTPAATGQRNREHPWKQTVSSRACLLQLALARADQDVIYRIAEADYYLLDDLKPHLIPADVLYRATTNLLRGLLPLTLDTHICQQVLLPLQGLRQELRQLRYVPSRCYASERHLATLESLCYELELFVCGRGVCQPQLWLGLMINTSAITVASGFEIWLQRELSKQEY
ncbi:glycosyltransferase family 2 protein [cyanobiont of Ornithocercus magnificus]|nr:glycosyltransferase family 2 protein [cyanobiont of Ornithocercus magnificus]